MIPAGLAATHVAFNAWEAAVAGNGGYEQLDDDTLRGTYQALAALLRQVEHAHAQTRDLVLRRVGAAKETPT